MSRPQYNRCFACLSLGCRLFDTRMCWPVTNHSVILTKRCKHTDINGPVRHIHTHTKGRKCPLDVSSYPCVYLATAQGYMSCLSAQLRLEAKKVHTPALNASTSFTESCRNSNRSEQSKHELKCGAICNNSLRQERIYSSTSDDSHRKVRPSTGPLAHT